MTMRKLSSTGGVDKKMRHHHRGAHHVQQQPLRPLFIIFLVVVFHLFSSNMIGVQRKISDESSPSSGRLSSSAAYDSPRQHHHQQQQQQEPLININVVLAMFGAKDGFLQENDAFLRSLLLNSPIITHRSRDDDDEAAQINVYILANQEAYDSIGPTIFHRMGVSYPPQNKSIVINSTVYDPRKPSPPTPLTWWLPVTIHVINVQKYSSGWMDEVRSLQFRSNESKKVHLYDVHTEGTFYRLFAHRVLPEDVDYFIYSDSDVIFLADVSDLWQLTKPSNSPPEVLFHWGKPICAGFLVVKNTPDLWDLINQTDLKYLNNTFYEDQELLTLVQQVYPERVKILPDRWNYVLAWGFYNKDNLQEIRPQLGMGHLTSGGDVPWWENEHNLMWIRSHDKRDPLFSTFFYYVDMPWSQVQYMAHSKMSYRNQTGYPVRAVYIDDPSTWNRSKAYQAPTPSSTTMTTAAT